MREMKDSGIPWIGEIPKEWETNTIGNLYTLRNEKVSDKDFAPLSVTKNGIVPQLETAAKTDDGDNRKLVRVGDFCINSRSDRRGSCGISPYDGSVSLINTILTPRSEMSPRYYDWLFHTTMFADEFYKWGHGIVDDLWTTRWQEMKRIAIPLPSLAEQQRIAEFLDRKCAEVDEMIGLQEQIIEELKAYKQSVITEAVTKGLNPDAPMRDSGIEWIGQIPEHWKICKNRYLFKENVRQCNGTEISLSLSQADGLVPTSEMKESAMKSSSYENWKAVKVDDIVLNRFKAHLGVLFRAKLEGMVSFHYGVYEAITKLCPQYFEYLYHSDNYKYVYSIMSNGMVVGLQNLSNTNFYRVDCIVPPLTEQQAIADYLDEKCADIDSLIQTKQSKIDSLKEYKKSIIYEYVTGKREVE